MNLGQRVVQNPDFFWGGGLILLAVLPVRACPGGRRGPAAGTIGSSSIPCSQDGFSHGSCNRPAGRGDRSPPTGSRPQSPPYPADHRAATGTEPGGRDRGRAGPPAARPRPSRAGRVVRGRSGLVPAADDPDQARALIVDGAPVPCRDRKHEPGPHSGRHHRAGPALGQAPPGRAGPPGRLHPGRKTRTGARPGPRIDPRRESPSADRSPRQSPGHAATGRRGLHRTGHDNPDTETSRGRTRGPAEAAQQDHQFVTGPGRTSNSPVISSARSMFRLVRISMTRSRWSSSSWLTASVCPGIRPPSARLRRRGRSGGPGHGLGAAQARREAP